MKILLFVIVSMLSISSFAAEDFKGPAPKNNYTLGAMTGLAVYDGGARFALIASGAKKIIKQGFAPEITNQVFIEGSVGPAFGGKNTIFVYSAHLRWDFTKDEQLTPYALGGLAGGIGSDKFDLFLRFGVGIFWHYASKITFRAEASHELIIAGVSFAFD